MRIRTVTRSFAVVVALLFSITGCSHTWFQFTVSANELAHIENTKNALAASYRDPNALAQVVDLDGRRAVETLIAGMATEHTDGDEQFQRLTRVLMIGIMGDDEDPLSMLDPDITLTAARVGQRVAGAQLQQFGLGGLAEMAGAALGTDSDGQRLSEMQFSLEQGAITTCGEPDVIVSYDAGILGHISTQMTDQDATYQAWRSRVRSIHLVRFQCNPQHVLMVLSRNHGEAGLRVIGWHFATHGQWQQMRPGMRRAFDLPRDP
jgi:hypothetical protein